MHKWCFQDGEVAGNIIEAGAWLQGTCMKMIIQIGELIKLKITSLCHKVKVSKMWYQIKNIGRYKKCRASQASKESLHENIQKGRDSPSQCCSNRTEPANLTSYTRN